MKLCIVIPNYNHGKTLDPLLTKLSDYQLPCIIVDDGSDLETKQYIAKATDKFNGVEVITLPTNHGKGYAVKVGLQHAHQQGYTHVLQIDADGQHDTQDITIFLNAATQHSHAFITGAPMYDETIPKGRLYGRAITNWWVKIETLSWSIPDAMCGYRIYPLKQTIAVITQYALGNTMDFDIEIMVKLYWEGCEMVSIPTKVIYPENGISHFKLLHDNMRISWMHTKLFFGMLKRLPKLLLNKMHFGARSSQHWSQTKEKGVLLGLQFILFSYQLLGKRLTGLFLYPISAYFYCTGKNARDASKRYLEHLRNFDPHMANQKISSFKHFLSFADAALDKLAVWNNDINMDQIIFKNKALFLRQLNTHQGAVVFTSHLGNIEIARSLSRFEPNAKINALVFTTHAKKFNSILEKINPKCKLNVIEVQDTDIKLAIELKQKIDSGEMIVIVGDRTSTTQPKRYVKAHFLNHEACFPQGPFILASILRCPVYFMLCLKQKAKKSTHGFRNEFNLVFEKFSDRIETNHANRSEQLSFYAQQYADLLSNYCTRYPLQWFNFFNFWEMPDNNRV